MSIKPKVLSIILGVADLEKSLAFYRDGLGLLTEGVVSTTDQPGDTGRIVPFDMGSGQTLSLYARADLARDTRLPLSPSSPLEFELMYYADSTDEVDKIMNQAKKERFWAARSTCQHPGLLQMASSRQRADK